MVAPSDDYYALLGVEAKASASELRRAWRRLALRWHPDRAGDGATATFQKLQAAYTVLSDPVTRAAYDRTRSVRSADATSSRRAVAPRAPSLMLQRLTGPLQALLRCGVARRAEAEVIELFLSAQEATSGGMATISMRVPIRCPACVADSSLRCTHCGGTRAVEELFSAWLAIPPGVTEGAVLTPSVPLRGMLRPVSFKVRLEAEA